MPDKLTKIVLARVGSTWLEAEVGPNWLALTMFSQLGSGVQNPRSIGMLLQYEDITTFKKNVFDAIRKVAEK